MADKIVVALLFGGRSSEHSISCATAGGVLNAIDRDRYEVIPVGITRGGAFVLEADDASRFALDATALPEVHDNGTRVRFPDSAASRELRVIAADGTESSLGDVDVVFPILHGPFGEDGTIQGMLELVDLPYVGSGVLASSLGMDKHFTKTVLAQAGIDVAEWVTVSAFEWQHDKASVLSTAQAALRLPAFVKPARAGSSVGVSKVADWSDLAAALDIAFAEDSRVLIEQGISGREIELAVLQGAPGQPPRVSLAGEIVMSGREFYDFEAKYLGAAGIDLVCPADVDAELLARLQAAAAVAFDAIGCEGLARVDFFVTDEGRIVLNELNTMPGFTPISMFPSCWMASGLSYPELINELISLAHTR